MNSLRRFVVLLLTAITTAGCGDDTTRAFVSDEDVEAPNYVKWTQDGNELSGTMYFIDNDDFSVKGAPLTGTIDGEEVDLIIEGFLGSTLTLPGKLDGDSLELDFDGKTERLSEGNRDDFNRRVEAAKQRFSQ